MQTIKFDGDRLFQDLVEHMISFMSLLIADFHREVTSGMKASDNGVDPAEYDEARGYIEAQCWFEANSIMESYGTGLGADTSSPYWNEYVESKFWNELRKGPQIVGRPQGPYTNIFGEEVSSSGRFEGKNRPGPNRKATRVIQRAEAFWIKDGQTRADVRIKDEIDQFLAENASKYFVEVRV